MLYKEKKRLLFFGIPNPFVTYTISDELITIQQGFFNRTEDDAYLYKVIDCRLNESFLQRIFRLGTIECYGGDTTHPALQLINIRNSHEIKDFIVKQSESERQRKHTLNTMNISGGPQVSRMAQVPPQ